jgi:hypothetical protein
MSDITPSFIETLKQITPEQAEFLDQVYKWVIDRPDPFPLRRQRGIRIGRLHMIALNLARRGYSKIRATNSRWCSAIDVK